ncbi:uncharacterized protein L201_000572 [Kwoniella dendrophila CBS 6074]|uniref:F-box domain-containing protein n=1 Tax=Kwoniella dendrophila CBS 6074 TaxID=1295534 RepID=A0AAX4JJZ6_9TREE
MTAQSGGAGQTVKMNLSVLKQMNDEIPKSSTSTRIFPDGPTSNTDATRNFLNDSDSDLTELSDIDMKADTDISDHVSSSLVLHNIEQTGSELKGTKHTFESSSDTDADSEYEIKPSKKKTKKNTSTKTQKSKPSKSSKNKSKWKKGKERETIKNEEEDEKPKKKIIRAKQVYWKDIPDWGGRIDCPILELPEEILDLCFGLKTGLTVRDYIALAGVSRYFRNRFTPSVFHAICWYRDVREFSRWNAIGSSILKPENKPAADHIFSTNTSDWKTEPKQKIYKYGKPSHYIPDGPRENWSEAQFIVYKEEQAKWKNKVKQDQLSALRDELEKAEEEMKRMSNWITLGRVNRRVLGSVKGRKNGDPPVEKDKNGLPLLVPALKENVVTPPSALGANTSAVVKERPTTKNKLSRSKRWTIPDSDAEEEYEISPDSLLTGTDKFVHDYWPNQWREVAVKWINGKKINKTDALKTYKVTESELLCLSHLLVTNPMSAHFPQQAYIEAAVHALALRTHGGVDGHKAYLQNSTAKSQKLARNRRAKIRKAKADGTYIYKHEKRHVPPYMWYYMDPYFGHGPNGDCISDCEACLRERYGEDWSD